MGHKVRRKIYRLRFDGPDLTELADLEVSVKGLSTGQFLKVTRGAAKLAGLDTSAATAEVIGGASDDVAEMFGILGSSLVSWNLEDEDGTPVPATYDGLMDQDLDLVLPIVQAWTVAMAGVAPPLPDGSPDGGQFPEASIPMTALSSPSRGS